MIPMLKRSLDRGLEINDRVALALLNGFDWVFKRDQLVQSGRTPFELVHQGDPMSVRHYDLADEDAIELADGSSLPVQTPQYLVPLVLIPPLGVTTEAFDLMPNRSLARYMAARGFKTYMIDWGKPDRRHARLGLADYSDSMMNEALAAIRTHSGAQQVSLMGWCMGGLLAIIHAGYRKDPRIVNIVTVASPIDLQGGGIIAGAGQAVNAPVKLLRKLSDFRLHSLDPARLHVPGWMTTIIFKMTNPVGSFTTYWDLLTKLWDREFVESHSTTSDYLNNMLAYPGGVLRDMVVRVGVDNQLASGAIELGKKVSRFRNIYASLLVFAGEKDALVSASTAEGLVALVSSADKKFAVAPGGHMGVILGSQAQKFVWAQTADWLGERSDGSVPAKAAAKAPAKTAAPVPAKAPAKTTVKAPVRTPAKTTAKIKSPVKPRANAARGIPAGQAEAVVGVPASAPLEMRPGTHET
jgi:polyhydroxyalkanoate synthase